MALQAILQAIAADAETKAGAILADAEAEAEQRLAAARLEANDSKEAILAKARIAAEHERSRLLHRARLDASRLLVAAQEDAFQSILRAVAEQLGTVRQRSDYPDLFAALLTEALSVAAGSSLKLSVDPTDMQLAATLLPGDRTVDLAPGMATWGGVTVSNDDGRVITHNTFESRLERAMPDLRPLLGPLLHTTMKAGALTDGGRE